MTYLATPQNYSKSDFGDFVNTLDWTNWKPKFITLHNTGAPTLMQWLHDNNNASHKQRLVNIDAMYKREGWHSAVHLFIGPEDDGIWNACDLTQDGVSVSCWNHVTLGIEMVGNYALLPENKYPNAPPIDSWTSPQGQQVRDNAVYAMAVLHNALGLEPDNYVEGVSGLHFHRECKHDAHSCPGGQVDKADMVARVKAMMLHLSSDSDSDATS